MVNLKWRLHFEFVTASSTVKWKAESLWEAPKLVDIETMVWDLAILIHPTSSGHIFKAMSGEHDAHLLI